MIHVTIRDGTYLPTGESKSLPTPSTSLRDHHSLRGSGSRSDFSAWPMLCVSDFIHAASSRTHIMLRGYMSCSSGDLVFGHLQYTSNHYKYINTVYDGRWADLVYFRSGTPATGVEKADVNFKHKSSSHSSHLGNLSPPG